LPLIDADPLTGIQGFDAARQQRVPHIHLSLIHDHERGSVFILDADIKDGAAHGDDSGWRINLVVVRLAADLLDLDFHAAEKNLEQVFPVPGSVPENHA